MTGLIGQDKATVSGELRRGLWFTSNENVSYRPLPAEAPEDRAVDVRTVLLGVHRAEEGGPQTSRNPETASHGRRPAALVGDERVA